MDIKEFIEKYAGVFDETEVTDLAPDTRFRELEEWSSLSALSTIAFADEEFDVELTGNEMRSVNTIEELYLLIKSKQ